ncbi:twin-arginine translocation pathway signal [Bradyrhizobium manausense]|uniref:twin-arginine translocation pathway signal n=1 Tax=Bradyrhizobium TaxID=374 RepID=UPI001BA7CCF0|nr:MULTISPECIES: twin-arginine translocation pathway signal [Bradyrhizobium]MBR0826910.1 twin-arginine translocation pathway signal [Bradyrhizobium manausense]UVO32192.1 twin-arginine translocation pathway signal [Bradyrhizobium arachidis]
MLVSNSHRLRACCALLVLLASAAALSGCASVGDTISPAFADPGKYELWDCKQLEGERKTLAARTADLQKLMDKAQTGVGGAVVSEMAYRNDYVAVQGQKHFAEEAWRKNRCRESVPGAAVAGAPPTPPVVAPAGTSRPQSKSGGAVY